MVFSEYINSLPKKSSPRSEAIKKIAEACCVDPSTVYRWTSGMYKPDALKRRMIANVLRIPEHELFPEARLQ